MCCECRRLRTDRSTRVRGADDRTRRARTGCHQVPSARWLCSGEVCGPPPPTHERAHPPRVVGVHASHVSGLPGAGIAKHKTAMTANARAGSRRATQRPLPSRQASPSRSSEQSGSSRRRDAQEEGKARRNDEPCQKKQNAAIACEAIRTVKMSIATRAITPAASNRLFRYRRYLRHRVRRKSHLDVLPRTPTAHSPDESSWHTWRLMASGGAAM